MKQGEGFENVRKRGTRTGVDALTPLLPLALAHLIYISNKNFGSNGQDVPQHATRCLALFPHEKFCFEIDHLVCCLCCLSDS